MKIVAFRATPERRQKLELLARGEGVTLTEVLNRLVDSAPVKERTVKIEGLVLTGNANSRSAQNLVGTGATAVSA